jgi:predicted amidohydrolase YtcJ
MRRLFLTLTVVLCIGCGESGAPPATTIVSPGATVSLYFNGPILTMTDVAAPAVAVQNGRIVMVDSPSAIKTQFGDKIRMIDLQGKTLMPGFFDAHSHVTMSAAKLAVVNTDPPPAGPADSIESIQRVLRERLLSAPPAAGEWLVGWGYDNAMLAEGRHPTRADLDAVSTEIPIVLIHFSSHQVVVNSMGLQRAGISAATPDPKGGRIERFAGSEEPNGILQENAMYGVIFPVLNTLLDGGADIEGGEAPGEKALQYMDAALQEYMREGFTTVTEMGATPLPLALLQEMARQRRLPVDVVAMPLSKAYQPQQVADLYSARYHNRLRVGGVKIILDGGSPGRSAYLREPYYVQLPGEINYRGYPHIGDQDTLNALVAGHHMAGNPLYIHALGDAALDQAIVALRGLPRSGPGPGRRTQIIHVQQAQADQLDALAELETTLTFQVAHNFYFGDFHREKIYGPARTQRLNPAKSALERNLSVSIHHDSPVHPIDQFTLIWAAVNRLTRSGQVIGEDQKITVLQALRASTIEAAYQFYEDDRKGSIEVGKLADLIILSHNPLEIDPLQLRSIQVLQTIKDGETVYQAAGN